MNQKAVFFSLALFLFSTLPFLAGCRDVNDITLEAEPGEEQVIAPNYCPESDTAIPSFPGMALPGFTTGSFVGSGRCAICHGNLADSKGNDVSMDADWRSTMMANAARDPLWQAKVSSEVTRTPGLQAVIEEKCATCHMPMATTQARADNTPIGIFGTQFTKSPHSLHAAATDGVSCTLCHQIQDIELGNAGSFSGGYNIDTAAAPPDRPIFGPFSQPRSNQMRNMIGYTPVLGTQTEDSGLCATCHTLFTPFVNAQGEVIGEFPEQTPYLEWESSSFGDGVGDDITCQQCHMPEAEGAAVISNMPRNLPARSPFAKHYFVGGNRFMLEIMKSNAEDLALTAATIQLDNTIDRTLTQLTENSAKVAITNAELDANNLVLSIEVTNQAGHKLPTGYPARRVWLHLTVTDASGRVVFESGKPEPDGSISGNDANADPASYEPHHDVIRGSDQVQIYETIMRDSDGQVTQTLLRAAAYAKDNRLLPLGFEKSNVSEYIAVYGHAVRDNNFTGGADQLTYQIDTQMTNGPYTVSVALLHQTVSYQFMQDLIRDDTPQIQRFSGYYDDACKMPSVMYYIQHTIE